LATEEDAKASRGKMKFYIKNYDFRTIEKPGIAHGQTEKKADKQGLM